jgi:hypothetical protein
MHALSRLLALLAALLGAAGAGAQQDAPPNGPVPGRQSRLSSIQISARR